MPYNPLMLNNKNINIPKEKPKPPIKSLRERLLCWVRLLVASLLAGGKLYILNFHDSWLLIISGLCSLIFLALMVVDPALSTLNGHYEPEPAECRVVSSRHVIGNSNTNCLRLSSLPPLYKYWMMQGWVSVHGAPAGRDVQGSPGNVTRSMSSSGRHPPSPPPPRCPPPPPWSWGRRHLRSVWRDAATLQQ